LITAGIWAALFLSAQNPQTENLIQTTPIIPDASILADVRYTQDWDANTSDNTIQISYQDAQRLMKIAAAEAGNQGVEGQLKVMEVVWNRVLSDNYPDTIEGVITQPNRFSSYTNGMYDAAVPTSDTHLALAEFEKNIDLNKEIIGFETVANHKSLEKYFDYSFTVGDHDFYVEKKEEKKNE
jgi:hypothetical protein